VAGTVDFGDSLAVLFEPGIAEGVFGLANGDDFAAQAEDGGVFEEAEFGECRTATGARLRRRKSEKLADVDQQQGFFTGAHRGIV
jgi:hypothetical protein